MRKFQKERGFYFRYKNKFDNERIIELENVLIHIKGIRKYKGLSKYISSRIEIIRSGMNGR
jgi:hypothetical protein